SPARRPAGSPLVRRRPRRCSRPPPTTAPSARSPSPSGRRPGRGGPPRPRSPPIPRPGAATGRRSPVPAPRGRAPPAPTPRPPRRARPRDFNALKWVGALPSTTRTADQPDAAIFWQDPIFALFTRIFRTLAGNRRLGLADDARLFAVTNLAAADAAIGCWND